MNCCLLSLFGPITPKSKNSHKFNSFNLLMLNETILEMPYCQLNFGKNKLEIFTFGEGLGADFHIWAHWPKIEKGHELRHCDLLGVLNTLLALFYPGGKGYARNSMFLKYMFRKIYLCILGQKCNSPHNLSLHVFYSIYYFFGFSKYVYLF